MARRAPAAALAVALLVGMLIATIPGASAKPRTAGLSSHGKTLLFASLNGENEVPGPGDADARGSAVVTVSEDRVCFVLHWRRLEAPTNAHIHRGASGVAGPIVVPLFLSGGLPPTLTGVSGCVDGVDPALARDIRRNPRDFYVNIHNATFPAGAIRGQLHRLFGR